MKFENPNKIQNDPTGMLHISRNYKEHMCVLCVQKDNTVFNCSQTFFAYPSKSFETGITTDCRGVIQKGNFPA